ncbi:hypothetical protein V2J09_018971 [Rumex salicifolius]
MAGKQFTPPESSSLSLALSHRMAEIETLGILEEIESLVSDSLQVVSYKWLSRNFLVSSNVAKKLLEEFVEKHNEGVEVVYTMAGWLKKTPPIYHIKLVPGPKLADAKDDFADNCSVQVYSVQSCIPKDTAALWNAEFVQAEELFKQPAALDNCLRDNRFCGILNSYVERNSSGTTNEAPQPKGVSVAVSSANQVSSFPQLQQRKPQQSSSKLDVPKPATAIKSECDNTSSQGGPGKLSSDTGKCGLPASKNKAQTSKSSAGSGGLANFWDRASAKSKSSVSAEANIVAQKKNDAQTSACEALDAGSSDDERLNINLKRASNGGTGKKRRFLLDDSDEEIDFNDAVSLSSPDPPKAKSIIDSKQKIEPLNLEKKSLKLDDKQPEVKEDKSSDMKLQHVAHEPSDIKTTGIAIVEQIHGNKLNDACKKNQADSKAPSSPKRRKVLKTRIDERGREVTEVVWEGEETGKQTNNKADTNGKNQTTKTEHAAVNPVNRSTTVNKKQPATANTATHAAGKAGNKKGANKKDPKQGNILSFFKKA